MTYVLVMKKGSNYKIGLNEYDSLEKAVERQSELKTHGINMKVMTFDEAYGL